MVYLYKREVPEKGLGRMKTDDITVEKVLELNETKQVRPICLVHQRWLFILLPGFKSYAFDFYTLRHIAFPALTIPGRVH